MMVTVVLVDFSNKITGPCMIVYFLVTYHISDQFVLFFAVDVI